MSNVIRAIIWCSWMFKPFKLASLLVRQHVHHQIARLKGKVLPHVKLINQKEREKLKLAQERVSVS